jgi:uncharacterized protein YcfJ
MKIFAKAVLPLAVVGLLAVGCQTTPTQQGALTGGALGAGAGAIIGHQSGNQGEGALIGAAAGALMGALIGDRVDEHRYRHNEPRYGTSNSATTQPRPQEGHYETRVVISPNGERYEERVWVPHTR